MAVPNCPSQPLVTAPPLPGAVIAYSGLFVSLRPCERWSVVTSVLSIVLPVALFFVIFLLSAFVFTSYLCLQAL